MSSCHLFFAPRPRLSPLPSAEAIRRARPGSTRRGLSWLGGLAVLCGVTAAGAQVAPAEPRAVVAEATFVIGAARIGGADGAGRSLDKGAVVHIGEKIETGPSGHVHLRFVDGARVSIRPSSRLAVEDYTRTAGGSGAVKFRLEEGVVRSITGEWGENSRETFRLNTPLAAIGIKGTDFVARADAERTVASVFAGAIVFSPLDAQCAASLGPCLNGHEALLTQDMRGQALQIERDQVQPRLIAAGGSGGTGSGARSMAVVAARVVPATDSAGDGVDAEPADKSRVSAARASGALVAAANTPPRIEQLAWGRWFWAKPIDGDTLAQTIDEAFRAGRQGLVSDGAYGLFRPAPEGSGVLAAREPSASFRLAGGSAYVVDRNGGTLPASVTGGSLGVDFARSTFSTRLDLTGASFGAQQVSANGSVLANGVLLSTSGNAYLAGGLSLDGREAGYFFDKAIDGGQLRGITLWGR